jgi:hypothetical protein
MPTVVRCETPSYVDLLGRISVAESGAGRYFAAWAEVTPDACLAETLRLVAARETSHGEVFCRRVAELGGALEPCPDIVRQSAERLAVVADPAVSDLEKIGPSRNDPDPFARIEQRMADDEFDPLTAHMLTWYIAEERDTIERLQDAYATVRAQGKASKKAAAAPAAACPSADAEAIMTCMTEGFARLEKSIEKLAKAVK